MRSISSHGTIDDDRNGGGQGQERVEVTTPSGNTIGVASPVAENAAAFNGGGNGGGEEEQEDEAEATPVD